ncbi:MAG: tetratricopeptide repeat protein [Thermoanaerobaculia bacterium]|nr:tetratricopeptide repeat protein [Thermoanaerobaculia bacterium]
MNPARRGRGRAALPTAALTLWAALAGAPARSEDPAAPLTTALTAAEEAFERKEPEIAESQYRSALREGWLLMGTLLAETGDLERAAEAFERAAGAAADDRRARVAQALVALESDRPDEAAILLRRLAARDPADTEVRQTLARALAAAGNLDEAVQELEEVLALAPDELETLFFLATGYLRQGRPEMAEPLLTRLAAERPQAETHLLIGRTWRDHAHYDRARTALRKALEIDPGLRRAHYYLGTVELLAEGRGRVEEAIAHFRAELAVAPDDAMTNLYLGIALVESRQHEEALGPLERATGSPLSHRDAHQFLGRALLALDRAEEAVTALRRALELAQETPMAAPGGVFVDLGESQLSSLHYQLALALRRSGRPEEAEPHFARAREHSARLAESTRETLSRYLEDETSQSAFGPPLQFPTISGLDAAQRERLERRVRAGLARASFDLGVLKAREGRFDGAARLLADTVELVPDFPRGAYSLGVALYNAGRFEEATAPLERARAGSPGDPVLGRMLALAHLNGEGYAEAAELLEDDPERASNPSLQYAYGVALVRSDRAAEAADLFSRLIADNADWPELHVVLGQAAAQQGDYEAAAASLRRALELDPGVAEAHATLGDILLRQGRLDEAERELEAELAAHPGDERARYTLALVMDLNRKPEEAKRLLRRHLDARPRSADGRYLLGKILLGEGALEDALEQLEVAAELAPDDPNVRYQLGQALQKLGRGEEAARQFEAFRELKQASRRSEGA